MENDSDFQISLDNSFECCEIGVVEYEVANGKGCFVSGGSFDRLGNDPVIPDSTQPIPSHVGGPSW
jgi:hypothetical protein